MSRKPKWLIRQAVNRILHIIAQFAPGATSLRVSLHKLRGVKVKGRIWISSGVYIDDGYPETVELHDDVVLGVRTVLISHFRTASKGIVIEKHAFIGACCVIMPNVRIGEGAVVAAMSLVNKDVPPYTLVGGVPAKPIAKVTYPLGIKGSEDKFREGLMPLEGAKDHLQSDSSESSRSFSNG